jgi:hypothetical protein
MPTESSDYRRIFVAGRSGSGKTTLARRLSAELGAFGYDLDLIPWLPGRDHVLPPERLAMFAEQLAAEERWIVEGNHVDWVEPLLERADVICMLDVPAARAMLQHVRREVVRWAGGGPRFALGRFLKACANYYVPWRAATSEGLFTGRSVRLGDSARFGHKVRHFASAAAARAFFVAPPASVLAAHRRRLSIVQAVSARVREGEHAAKPWFWYDAGDPVRGVAVSLAAAHDWSRVIATDLPDRTDVVTGRRHPMPIGEPLVLLTSREDVIDEAVRRLEASGLCVEAFARHSAGSGEERLHVAIGTPRLSGDALVHPLPLEAITPSQGSAHRLGGRIRVVTPPASWHYAASIEIASLVPAALAEAVGQIHLRGVVDRGPVGLGVLAHGERTFLARRPLRDAAGPFDVYLPVSRLGDAARVVVQTWAEARSGELTVDALEIVGEREPCTA